MGRSCCFCWGSSSKHSKEFERTAFSRLDIEDSDTTDERDEFEVTIDSSLPIEKCINYRVIENATNKFNPECLVGVGSFGIVYRGILEKTGEIIDIEHLSRNISKRDNEEFISQVKIASLLNHPNLMSLVGYCAKKNERYLVRQPLGSLHTHLHEQKCPLDWDTRMKIALGTAKALEYLHDKANPQIIYRNLSSLNILVDKDFNAKLSDFGKSELGPFQGDGRVFDTMVERITNVTPEYALLGELSLKTDVFCFGLVFLELLSGKQPHQLSYEYGKHMTMSSWHTLVSWITELPHRAKRLQKLVDPLLLRHKDFSFRRFYNALAVVSVCVSDKPTERPVMSDVVSAISFLCSDESLLKHPVIKKGDEAGVSGGSSN